MADDYPIKGPPQHVGAAVAPRTDHIRCFLTNGGQPRGRDANGVCCSLLAL